MKNLITLSTFAALPLCLLAESDKTLIPGTPTLERKDLGPVTQEEIDQLRQRAIELSQKGEQNREALEKLRAALQTAADQETLQGRDPAFAIEGKTIDDILNNPDRRAVAGGPEILSLPFTEKQLTFIAEAIAASNKAKGDEPNDGGIDRKG